MEPQAKAPTNKNTNRASTTTNRAAQEPGGRLAAGGERGWPTQPHQTFRPSARLGPPEPELETRVFVSVFVLFFSVSSLRFVPLYRTVRALTTHKTANSHLPTYVRIVLTAITICQGALVGRMVLDGGGEGRKEGLKRNVMPNYALPRNQRT